MSSSLTPEACEICNDDHASNWCAPIILLLLLEFVEPRVGALTTTPPALERAWVLESARLINDAELPDQDGHPFRLSQLHDQVSLVFFGITNCPEFCPMAMQKLRQLGASGGFELANVAYVMISVDGERDTPDVLKTYLAKFSPRFIGLTGQPGSVEAIATEFSAAIF